VRLISSEAYPDASVLSRHRVISQTDTDTCAHTPSQITFRRYVRLCLFPACIWSTSHVSRILINSFRYYFFDCFPSTPNNKNDLLRIILYFVVLYLTHTNCVHMWSELDCIFLWIQLKHLKLYSGINITSFLLYKHNKIIKLKLNVPGNGQQRKQPLCDCVDCLQGGYRPLKDIIKIIRSGNGSALGGWAICCAAGSSCWLPSGSWFCPLQVEQRTELRWDFAPSVIGGPLYETQTVIKHFTGRDIGAISSGKTFLFSVIINEKTPAHNIVKSPVGCCFFLLLLFPT